MESTPTHVIHAVLLVAVLYIIMRFVLGQTYKMAMTRSTLIGAVALIYMILFGHGLPTRMNRI